MAPIPGYVPEVPLKRGSNDDETVMCFIQDIKGTEIQEDESKSDAGVKGRGVWTI